MKTITYSVLALLAGVCIGNFLPDSCRLFSRSSTPLHDTITELRIDTIVVHDTILATIPSFAQRPSPRTVILSRKDVTVCDSDSLRLRAVQRVYADSTFRAVVSGADPRLDTLVIFRTLPTVTHNVTTRLAPTGCGPRYSTRWSLGITAGATLTPHGLSPGLTLGVSYRLWP